MLVRARARPFFFGATRHTCPEHYSDEMGSTIEPKAGPPWPAAGSPGPSVVRCRRPGPGHIVETPARRQPRSWVGSSSRAASWLRLPLGPLIRVQVSGLLLPPWVSRVLAFDWSTLGSSSTELGSALAESDQSDQSRSPVVCKSATGVAASPGTQRPHDEAAACTEQGGSAHEAHRRSDQEPQAHVTVSARCMRSCGCSLGAARPVGPVTMCD